MIDIIIPAYNAKSTISKTLASIAYQENIDNLNVYIVNDGSNYSYDEEIAFFKKHLNITELTLDSNLGPGKARQYGVDNSNSEYIIFLDADDILYSPFALSSLYNNIANTKYDVGISSFYECLSNGEILKHDNDTTWLHGKIYKRSFLEKNNIRFFGDSYANEDVGYNQLILLYDANIKYIPEITYVWLYNNNSITKANNAEFKYSGIISYAKNILLALNIAIQNDCKKEKIAYYSYQTLVAMYFYYLNYYKKISNDDLLKLSLDILEIYNKYKSYLDVNENEIFIKQYQDALRELGPEYISFPKITFSDFLSKL